LPAASFVAAREAKDINEVNDLTLVIADVREKAIHQVRNGIIEILRDRVGEEKAVAMADKMATGTWTHDYGITASEAKELGLPVRVGMPNEILKLMTLYPQPVQMGSSVEYLPIEEPRRLFGTVGER
jgi:ClpP class serine protease